MSLDFCCTTFKRIFIICSKCCLKAELQGEHLKLVSFMGRIPGLSMNQMQNHANHAKVCGIFRSSGFYSIQKGSLKKCRRCWKRKKDERKDSVPVCECRQKHSPATLLVPPHWFLLRDKMDSGCFTAVAVSCVHTLPTGT